ncbi:MAG: hypothetical protein WC244_04890 [Patescibacteria group bacterium]
MSNNKTILRIYCHEPREFDSHATPEELDRVQATISLWAPDEPYEVIFSDAISPIRIRDYVKTVMSNGCCTHPCTLAEQAVDELGNHQWLGEIKTPEFLTAVESGLTALQAIDEVFSHKQIMRWEKRAAFAISTLLDDIYLKGLSIGLGWGTNPFLPLAARGLGWKGVLPLEEFGYIDFIYLHNSGKPTVMLP